MHVGILGGTGPLGRGLAIRLAAGGAKVTIGSREKSRAEAVTQELLSRWHGRSLSIEGMSNVSAADAEIVVASTPWDAVASTVTAMAEALKNKVVVSVGNALVKQGRELNAVFPSRGSVAAELQSALPQSLIAAACHHLPAGLLADLDRTLECDVLVCSDHPAATEATIAMLNRIDGLRPLDAGSLATSGPIEAFTAVLATLNIRYKARTTLRLGGLEQVGR